MLTLSRFYSGPHQSLITYRNNFLHVRHQYWQSGPYIHCYATARFKGVVCACSEFGNHHEQEDSMLVPPVLCRRWLIQWDLRQTTKYPRVPIIPEVALARFSSCRSGGICKVSSLSFTTAPRGNYIRGRDRASCGPTHRNEAYESWTKQHIPKIVAVRRPTIYENKMSRRFLVVGSNLERCDKSNFVFERRLTTLTSSDFRIQ
ncbi:hypothetical protein EV702DRAFT_629614 [Suillus placidus]|uniref:Uncharacterized protein n=1 Tax=Suillus placidus TaxID=48579 RepID=A0A9P6ZM75_9AGAM|nr:hypothetical protein EV702DRAFT_629614 [Suillus placidus]